MTGNLHFKMKHSFSMDVYVSLHFYGKKPKTFYKIYQILFSFFGVRDKQSEF